MGRAASAAALAERFAQEGMKLALVDIEASALERTVAELEAGGADVLPQLVDVAESEQMDSLARAVPGHFGAVHVVNTASLAGLISVPGTGPYNVTKHAVVTLSETLYGELAALGSKAGVSVLCPGFVNTRLWESDRNPLGLLGPI